MSKLSSRMVSCLRDLETGPQEAVTMTGRHTGWSVKALLRRGYVMPYDNMLAITPTGLAALQLEGSYEQHPSPGPRAVAAGAQVALGGVGSASVERPGTTTSP